MHCNMQIDLNRRDSKIHLNLQLTWDFSLSFLDDDEVENGEIGINDTTSDASSVTLSGAARAVARMLGPEQKTNATVGQHTLHHGETW